MRLMTWNMGHGSPGARRASVTVQWAVVAGLLPDVVLAQETREPEVEGYDVSFTRHPRMGWGAAVAVRQDYGRLVALDVLPRPGLVACWQVERASAQTLVAASVHVPSTESARAWLCEIAATDVTAGSSVVIGGDFNAGPSIGKNPVPSVAELGLLELTASDPERNTLVRPQHPGTTFQIDHVLGRGWTRQGPMCVLPFADVGGPQMSDHNALWITLDGA